MMAAIGEIALLLVAAFLFVGGCGAAWVSVAFTGKLAYLLMLIWSCLGIALGLFAIQNAPIRIEFRSIQAIGGVRA